MRKVEALLYKVYAGRGRMTNEEIHRRAIAAELPARVLIAIDALPAGEYTLDEASKALGVFADVHADPSGGVPASDLADADLLRELSELHRTRTDTLRHGSDQALAEHSRRTRELEEEYLRRNPQREVDPERLRDGARRIRTGGDHGNRGSRRDVAVSHHRGTRMHNPGSGGADA